MAAGERVSNYLNLPARRISQRDDPPTAPPNLSFHNRKTNTACKTNTDRCDYQISIFGKVFFRLFRDEREGKVTKLGIIMDVTQA